MAGTLTIAQFADESLVDLAESASNIMGETYLRTQTWSNLLHAHANPEVDGLQYRSRFKSGEFCIALFDRAITKGNLTLVDCECLLRLLLRRTWRSLPKSQRAQLQAAARHFEPERFFLASPGIEPVTAAWCLAAMHWRGCGHPAALFCAPVHPATALVRWLSEFSVVEQVQCPRHVLVALARDISRTRTLSRVVTAAMAAGGDVIALLPELLSWERPSRNDEKAQHYYFRQR